MIENQKPTCPICNGVTKYIKNGTMESYWGTFFVEYLEVPMYLCDTSCEKIYNLRVVNIAQNITKVLSEFNSSIKIISLKNILDFIGDDVLKQDIFINKLREKKISFIEGNQETYYVDELQLLKLNRYNNSVDFNDQILIAARDGKISEKDAQNIIKLLSDEEDSDGKDD